MRPGWILLLLSLPAASSAQTLAWHGYVDARSAASGDEQDWTDGGLGKARFGDDGTQATGGAVLAGNLQLTPALQANATLQFLPQQRESLDVLDASLRYRPVSTTPWRWSVRAGAFFPPVSLENDNIGWTSTWTLTPSAINSWIGEELRIFGAEARIEHRGDAGTLEAFGALFGRNDPAGELLAARGWAMGDLTSGVNASLREPDAYVPLTSAPGPALYKPFVEIDDRVGWYAGANWNTPAYRVALLRYDNRADPESFKAYRGRDVFSWHTRFWSLGAQTRVGDFELLGQLMRGSTAFEPVPELYLESEFNAGYLLVGWDRGAWQPALRVDLFQVRQTPGDPDSLSEHGNALTLALNWRPRNDLRISGEWLRIDSSRNQRRLEGNEARQVQQQLQLSVRFLF